MKTAEELQEEVNRLTEDLKLARKEIALQQFWLNSAYETRQNVHDKMATYEDAIAHDEEALKFAEACGAKVVQVGYGDMHVIMTADSTAAGNRFIVRFTTIMRRARRTQFMLLRRGLEETAILRRQLIAAQAQNVNLRNMARYIVEDDCGCEYCQRARQILEQPLDISALKQEPETIEARSCGFHSI